MRGVETRRHDTPQLFINFQHELMKTMSKCDCIDGIIDIIPTLELIYEKYVNLLISRKVLDTDLILTKRISKDSEDYKDRNTVENCVLKRLRREGKTLHAGELIKYIITNYYDKNSEERALPLELYGKSSYGYDEKRYLELLREVYDSTTKIFY